MRDYEEYIYSIGRDSDACASLISQGSLAEPVPSCPGWTVHDLVLHLGGVQRWAARAIVAADPSAGPPSVDDAQPLTDEGELRAWFNAGTQQLITALSDAAPNDPAWHPFSAPRTAYVWARRQAHEVAIHRWDLARAVNATATMDREEAADYVAEYFDVIAPRIVARDGRHAPEGTMAVDLADADVSFTVKSDGQTIARVSGDEAVAEHVLAGDAEEVLLALWGRQPIDPRTDSEVVRQWLAFGGN